MPRMLLVETDPFMHRTLQRQVATEEGFGAVAADARESTRLCGGLPAKPGARSPGDGWLNILREIRTASHVPIVLLARTSKRHSHRNRSGGASEVTLPSAA